jgi:mersacidin/lichenicidin family type 2 lantibiotic
MSHENIIRAWKDEAFRNSLSEKERALLPEHPAGLVELTDVQIRGASGARPPSTYRGPVCTENQSCGPI